MSPELLTPAWIGLLAGLIGYFVRSTVDTRVSSKIDEVKVLVTAVTVALARVEERQTVTSLRLERVENRVVELEKSFRMAG